MSKNAKPKAPWIHRFAIVFFSITLTLLLYWLLGFAIRDIKTIQGPIYEEIEIQYVNRDLVLQRNNMDNNISELTRNIENFQQEQQIVLDSSQNLERTMNQLLELQKLSIQKNITLSQTEQISLSTSLNRFLESQKKYQLLNRKIAELFDKKQVLTNRRNGIQEEIQQQQIPARYEFNTLNNKHRLKLAFYQLAVLIPFLLIGLFLIIQRRTSIYFPFYLALASSALIKVSLVIHEYFPTKLFKYVLIGVLILAIGRLLYYFIRSVAAPNMRILVKQYREAYERFLCPICEYPIRIGPRRFLYWTRRTVNKIILPNDQSSPEESYVCPSCGTPLFEKCTSCESVRHALLPFCRHCGSDTSTKV